MASAYFVRGSLRKGRTRRQGRRYAAGMAYDKRDLALRDAFARLALGLAGVFEMAQWGGWAYKVPDPRHGVKKAKLLCYVVDGKEHGWHAQFKLPGRAEAGRACDVVRELAWLTPHPWRTLGPAGWVVARPRTDGEITRLGELLRESRGLLPVAVAAGGGAASAGGEAALPKALPGRIDRVMEGAREAGWRFADPDAGAFGG